ncbi:MAG: 6,7-dimethyl-8-ribityllumazine synthase [Saprospiraceae bacterium]|nr:6,7-dimethyl-8-ribityllumazine synthase [Saprospiraceae bacterium]MBK8449564.1 6,7-dimethyl-8-ribityllumazine synthase [Saprospiraceae bacterium]MBK9221760.1 6,7-dimethyl-8-ribityllumazine synthase [Saprospiraceae bacterium]MBK9721303.1 6,7-dimethyl-8-ribityllumazine synthase [Saprospiraceae bacterium]
MAGSLKSISSLNPLEIQLATQFTYCILTAQWNSEITCKLELGAIQLLTNCGVPTSQIKTIAVPGSFELPLTAKWALEYYKSDAILCLGCIIQGETKHDEFIAHSISKAILDLNISSEKPIIFGVLTVNNIQQAEDRAGGKFGNKGEEAAITAIQMLSIRSQLQLSNQE